MSSPLDGRIRKLAREEVTALLDSIKSPSAEMAGVGKPVQAGELQQQITDLHEHLHHAATTIKRLEDRIDVLEKAAGHADQEQSPARRTRRKATDE
jgi:cell division septum initiation protein DivIVA